MTEQERKLVAAAQNAIRARVRAMNDRDRAIRRLSKLGWPATRIAAEIGMGIDNVRRILREGRGG